MVNIATAIFVVDFLNGIRNGLYVNIHQKAIWPCDVGSAGTFVTPRMSCNITISNGLERDGIKKFTHLSIPLVRWPQLPRYRRHQQIHHCRVLWFCAVFVNQL
jgi:hypothetical protein